MKSQNENSATDQKKKQNSKPYIFAQKEGDDFTCIKLIEGKYEGVVYKYNHVKFAPHENEQGQIPLKFTYDIFLNPNILPLNLFSIGRQYKVVPGKKNMFSFIMQHFILNK